MQKTQVQSLRKIPGEGNGNSTLIFLPGKSNEQRILVGYSPWGRKEPDTTEQLRTLMNLLILNKFQDKSELPEQAYSFTLLFTQLFYYRVLFSESDNSSRVLGLEVYVLCDLPLKLFYLRILLISIIKCLRFMCFSIF